MIDYTDPSTWTTATTVDRATAMLARVYRGIHHLPSPLKTLQGAVTYLHYGDLSTYDWDTLTRLVLGAHAYCLRVDISQGGPRSVRITVSGRSGRDGCTMTRKHPSIQEAIEHWESGR